MTGPANDRLGSDVAGVRRAPPVSGDRPVGKSWRRAVLGIPAWVWLAAVAAGSLHMAPYWRAALETEPGYTFTWNLSVNPDFMQYRVWLRQTQEEGIIVSNRFTLEPNRPHLPIFLYYAVGGVANLLDVRPEVAYAYAGGVFAFSLALLIWVVVRTFLPRHRLVPAIYLAVLFGGGISGYFKFVQQAGRLHSLPLVETLIVGPLERELLLGPFEGYRSGYVFSALLDTHAGFYWLLVTAAMLLLYQTVRRGTWQWIAATAAFFAFTTFMHVHQAFPLIAMSGGAIGLCLLRGLPVRRGAAILIPAWTLTGITLLGVAWLVNTSGLRAPISPRSPVYFTTLLIGFPLTFLVAAWGFGRWWSRTSISDVFLIGWAVGGILLLMSGPFYPFPERAHITLQIPLVMIAGAIILSLRPRLGIPHYAFAAVLLCSTPMWQVWDHWRRTGFHPNQPHKYLSDAHAEVVRDLSARATKDDVLIAEWRDLSWLAPEFPGRFYVAHSILTVEANRKWQEVARLMDTGPIERYHFLRDEDVSFLFVNDSHERKGFAVVPGLHSVREVDFGTLFTFDATSILAANDDPPAASSDLQSDPRTR